MANAWSWPMKRVPKTTACRYRIWVGTIPLQPLPNGGAVELRLHLKQWDQAAAEPFSWCLNLTKYASKDGGSMDPYQPLQQIQISERDWPTWFSTFDPDTRAILDEHLPRLKTLAPPAQAALAVAD